MINQTKALKLIKIYDYVCKKYEQELKYSCERFSNNIFKKIIHHFVF
jgi:hypothetical protein